MKTNKMKRKKHYKTGSGIQVKTNHPRTARNLNSAQILLLCNAYGDATVSLNTSIAFKYMIRPYNRSSITVDTRENLI